MSVSVHCLPTPRSVRSVLVSAEPRVASVASRSQTWPTPHRPWVSDVLREEIILT